jgi:iron complex outermembrane recepter protein
MTRLCYWTRQLQGAASARLSLCSFWLFGMTISFSAAQTVPAVDISELSLDTLASTDITSVSRKSQHLFQAAAAVFVITQEDLRRSGLNSIPEALRLVPGLDVAQIDANKWAITSRGFNERFADKMLVLMDGRAATTPLSSGVYWDVQDTTLADIDRIEVIRGPGATLWGANAVNGVVNIITKKAKDTQGCLLTASGGNQGGSTAVRCGAKAGKRGAYRIFMKYVNRDAFTDPSGGEAFDDWHALRAGFRADWDLSGGDDLTVQGDIYKGNEGQTVLGMLSLSPPAFGTFNDRTNTSGGNVLVRWHHVSSARLETTAQAYFDATDRNQLGVLGETRRTIDFEFEQHFASGSRHDLVWGGDFRDTPDHTVGSLNISFNPVSRTTQLYGAFFQDEITLLPDRLKITLGSKLEHNYFSGFAVQPNVRLLWELGPKYAVWSAISRASENSSRFDADIRLNQNAFVGTNGTVNLVSSFGSPGLPPENVVAYELGQRTQVGKHVSLDLALFYNHYTNRHTQEPAAPFLESSPAPLHIVLPTVTMSKISGETHGLELSAKWNVVSHWSVTSSYSFFATHLHAIDSLDVSTAPDTEGSSPRHEFQIHSQLDLRHHFQFDTSAFYVDRLAGPHVPAYTRVDARLGWQGGESWEISGGLQNLLTPRHFEFGSGDLVEATEVGRSAYARVTWKF